MNMFIDINKAIHIYIYLYISIYRYLYICLYMLPFQTENGSPDDFPKSVYHLLIVQRKLSVCKRTKRNLPIYTL